MSAKILIWWRKKVKEVCVQLVVAYHIFVNLTRWYAKRFLHPDVVAAYDYIFIWDEDLGVEHFNAEKLVFLFSFFFYLKSR